MQKKATLPILLKNQNILLIGGGNVALQKASVLFDNNISFSIVAKELNSELNIFSNIIHKKSFEINDIRDYFIVINASGDDSVTQQLLEYKKNHRLLLNVVDEPKYCDFYFMALTKNRPLQIAVSSNGSSPTVAKYFRDICEELIPKDINSFMDKLAEKRKNGIIEIDKTKNVLDSMQTKVFLVGCGLGDPELLTIKAYKTIQFVDVVLYDHLISKEIMAIVPKTTKKVFVGKEKGFHSKAQEEINALILEYTLKGYSVARLKSGDPFIFGRGAEELLYLNQLNIKTEVIAGISSAISAPLVGNIPLTLRGVSNSFSVVSAHLRGNAMNLDWVEQLKQKEHTLVVLMGLSRVKEIVKKALDIGIDKEKSCAIISNASRDNQTIIVTTVKNLEKEAQNASRPSIIVFGEVVKYRERLKEL